MSERRVWIAQCLCGPARHCISALAGEAEDAAEAKAEIMERLQRDLTRMIADGIFGPVCGICGAKASAWHYEVGRTRWGSIAEAEPHLRQVESANALAALLFGDGGSRGRPN